MVAVKDIEAEFLPLIYDIVKCVERDPSDAAAKNKVGLFACLFLAVFSLCLLSCTLIHLDNSSKSAKYNGLSVLFSYIKKTNSTLHM